MESRTDFDKSNKQRVKVDRAETPVSTVRYLQLQYPARVRSQGKVTGTWYEWSGAGAIVPVAEEDAEEFLSKLMNKQPCCNSVNRPQPKFVEV